MSFLWAIEAEFKNNVKYEIRAPEFYSRNYHDVTFKTEYKRFFKIEISR